MAAKMRWGDALDEEDSGSPTSVLPAPAVSGPDGRGIKTYTDYRYQTGKPCYGTSDSRLGLSKGQSKCILLAVCRRNEKGEIVKVTTKARVTRVQKKLYKASQPCFTSPTSLHVQLTQRMKASAGCGRAEKAASFW